MLGFLEKLNGRHKLPSFMYPPMCVTHFYINVSQQIVRNHVSRLLWKV